MPEKVDLKQEFKELYSARLEPHLIEVPPLQYLMVDGTGDPNTSEDYRAAVEALYGMAYALKFQSKKDSERGDFVVMPLEGLWWAEDMAEFSVDAKGDWYWTSMILQPSFITQEMLEQARSDMTRKKPVAALAKVRLETLCEGPSAQVLHLGPYSKEGPTIASLHAFISQSGHLLKGKHHEIYMSDPRRGDPAKTRTIIRQPVHVR